jgi:hypothetical protein
MMNPKAGSGRQNGLIAQFLNRGVIELRNSPEVQSHRRVCLFVNGLLQLAESKRIGVYLSAL